MTTLNKYRIWCVTDSKDEFTWAESENLPTVCPTDHAHTIGSIRIVQTIEENLVTINEHSGGLGGYYKTKGEFMQIPANYAVAGELTASVSQNDNMITVDQATMDAVEIDNYIQLNDGTTSGILDKIIILDRTNKQITVMGSSPTTFASGTNVELVTHTVDYIQKKDIGVLSYSFISSEANNGDGMDVHVYPNEPVGIITGNVSTGDTVLNVSQTVIDNMSVGFYCRLDDGNIFECMGEVLEIDTANNQITVEKPALHNFLASSPTYVKLTVRMAEVFDIGPPGPHQEGVEKIGSTIVKKNKPVRIMYNNHTGGAKRFVFYVGHLY